MLDMGFLPDIRKVIAKLPTERQTLFFSATLSAEIMNLARQLVKNPVEVSITPDVPAVQEIGQQICFVDKPNKVHLLVQLLGSRRLSKVIVFTKMKYMANRLAEKLSHSGIRAEAIHGDKAQNARQRSLENFKQETVRVLVATDIAARGIDVERVSHVINYDLPMESQTYIHRIGRTARAGTRGDAVSFCSAEERKLLRDIEALLGEAVPVFSDHPYHSEAARNAVDMLTTPQQKQREQKATRHRSRERLTNKISYGDGKKPSRPRSRRSGGR